MLRPLRPKLLPLRVGPLQQILGSGTAQMRAAVLYHHLAINVRAGVRNQEAREIRQLPMLPDTPKRVARGPVLVAPAGSKLAGGAGGRKGARRDRNGADPLRSPFDRETP